MKEKTFFNIIWYAILYIFKSLLPLLVLPIFTKYINIQDFGIYALSLFYGTFFSGVANLGLTSVFERNFFEIKQTERKKLLWNILLFVFFLTLLLALITFWSKGLIADLLFYNDKIEEYLLVAFLFQSFKTMNSYFLIYFKNDENGKTFTFFSILETILSIGLAYILVVKFSMGLYGFILGQAVGVIILFFSSFVFLLYPFKYPIDIEQLKYQLFLSLPLTPRIFIGAINTQFDRYMLGILGSLGGVGLFDIGQRIANTSFVFMTTLQNIYSPEVYKRFFSKNLTITKSIGSYLTPFFYISILFCLVLGLFSREILILLTPKEFHKASSIITVLCILYGFYFFGKQPQLLYAKKTKLITVLSLISIIINIGFNIPMIKTFGVMGAVWATTLAGIISSATNFYFGQKYSPIYYEKVIIFIIIYLLISLMSIYILTSYFNDLYWVINLKFLFIAGYIFIGFYFKVFNKKQLTYLLNTLKQHG